MSASVLASDSNAEGESDCSLLYYLSSLQQDISILDFNFSFRGLI